MGAVDELEVDLETRVGAPVERVFPLACPVEEYKWIPGWKCDLVHCPNERAELGTVFVECSSAPFLVGKTWARSTWTAVVHEPEAYRVHYAIKNAAANCLYKIHMSDDGSGGTLVRLDFRYSAVSSRGTEVIRNRGKAKIELMLQILMMLLRHYCERGELASSGRVAGLIASSDAMTTTDRIRLFLNTVAMRLKKDPLRQRYLRELAAGLR